MTMAHQHEEAYIQFKTMNRVKLTHSNLGAKIFIIECQTYGFCLNDLGLCTCHPKLFKYDIFTFMASNGLMRSMPFLFVDQLKKNVWTTLDKVWMKKLKCTLHQAEKNTIKQISLHRIIQPWYYHQDIDENNHQDKTESRKFVYHVTTEYGINSYATCNEIQETLGCEEWFHGNMNCLVNIGSNLDIQLKLGTRKKRFSKKIDNELSILCW